MSRTYRNVPDWKYSGLVAIPPDGIPWGVCKLVRVENRKARDGSGNHWVCQTAKEGKLNNWYDGGRGYGKQLANKEIRCFYKRDLRSRLVEHAETQALEYQEYLSDMQREDIWYDTGDRWDDWLEEQRYNEREYERDCAEARDANRYHSYDGLDLDYDYRY